MIKLIDIIIISIITNIMSIISENYLSMSNKDDNIIKKIRKRKNYIIYISLFGIIIYFILKYIKFEEWYCKKLCIEDKCKYICTIPL